MTKYISSVLCVYFYTKGLNNENYAREIVMLEKMSTTI